MTFQKAACILLSILLMLTMTACGTPNTAEETPTTEAPAITTVAIIQKDLAALLSAEEISQAVGENMNAPTVSNQGTTLTSLATDGKAVLTVELSEKPIEIYHRMLQGYADLMPCPNLGESAWYSPLYYQLLVYDKGYIILIELTGTADTEYAVTLLRCRQIAALLMDRL